MAKRQTSTVDIASLPYSIQSQLSRQLSFCSIQGIQTGRDNNENEKQEHFHERQPVCYFHEVTQCTEPCLNAIAMNAMQW